MNDEQLFALKNSMIQTTRNEYQRFLNAIKAFPCHEFHVKQACVRFDEGMFWLEQALLQAPISIAPVDDEPVQSPCDVSADAVIEPEPVETHIDTAVADTSDGA